MMKFSERYGHNPVRSALQISDIDETLRNRLWNVVCDTFFNSAPKTENARKGNYLPYLPNEYQLFRDLAHNFFKETTDTVGVWYTTALARVKAYFFGSPWYGVYDLIDFLADAIPNASERGQFIESVNQLLKDEMAGYRFVSERIVQITSEEEIAAIEQAMGLPDTLSPNICDRRSACWPIRKSPTTEIQSKSLFPQSSLSPRLSQV
jgi:hypothetical protein